jgi:hypothetical protein
VATTVPIAAEVSYDWLVSDEAAELFAGYGIPGDPIPTTVLFVAFGTVNETCVVYNKPSGGTVC